MDNKKKSFEDLMRETFAPTVQGENTPDQEVSNELFPMCDNIDAAIVMHREVHFGGSFSIMIDYYQKGGKGVQPAFTVPRIRQLQALETAAQQDLVEILLTPTDFEKVQEARDAYLRLRQICESQEDEKGNQHPKLLAHLILSEEEEAPEEVEAIVKEGHPIVARLLQMIQSPEFHDSLWPGYGLAPELAAKCVGRIGDTDAIITLFEAIEDYDFFGEDTVFRSLKLIGEPAKRFLLRILEKIPPTKDSERAARALIYFSPDEEVALLCLQLLQISTILNKETLATYLVLNCTGLKKEKDRQAFLELAHNTSISKDLQRDIRSIATEFA